MTDNEYERLAAVAESDGMTLGEWVREVLLERADGRKPSVIEETLLAETLALDPGIIQITIPMVANGLTNPVSATITNSPAKNATPNPTSTISSLDTSPPTSADSPLRTHSAADSSTLKP
jgi:hypothetical protein